MSCLSRIPCSARLHINIHTTTTLTKIITINNNTNNDILYLLYLVSSISVYMSIYVSIYLSMYQRMCMSIYLSTYLSGAELAELSRKDGQSARLVRGGGF